MSPRNERYQTPKYIAQGIRDTRNKLLHGSNYCPKCGQEKLMILIDKKKKEVKAFCPCGIENQLIFVPVFEACDYYSKFMDKYKSESPK